MMPREFRKIIAWQHAHRLTLRVYDCTRSFPVEERYGITSQLRRAAASVAANIVEGSSRSSVTDYLRFLEIAMGSLRESEYFLLLAYDLKLLTNTRYDEVVQVLDETARTLSGSIAANRRQQASKNPEK